MVCVVCIFVWMNERLHVMGGLLSTLRSAVIHSIVSMAVNLLHHLIVQTIKKKVEWSFSCYVTSASPHHQLLAVHTTRF